MTIIFDKNVPLPRYHSTTKKYYFEKMSIGESIFIPVIGRTSISSSITRAQKSTGFRYITRREENGIRLWRIA